MNNKGIASKLLLGLGLAGLVLIVIAFVRAPATADAGGFKNLQVLPKEIGKKELKTLMKSWARGLGVECKFCHDMDDKAKDTKKKKIARKMATMVDELNSRYMKKYKDAEITCKTCHHGHEKPKK